MRECIVVGCKRAVAPGKVKYCVPHARQARNRSRFTLEYKPYAGPRYAERAAALRSANGEPPAETRDRPEYQWLNDANGRPITTQRLIVQLLRNRF